MTAQHLFCIGYALTWIMFGSFFVLFKLSPTMQTFKRAGSKEAAAQIWTQWGAKGQKVARANLAYDWFFILVYSTTWVAGAMHFTALFPKFQILAWMAGAIGLVGTACDIAENLCLLKMMRDNNQSDSAPRICARVMRINILCWGVAAAYFLVAAIVACST